ncbi:acyl-CoA desaturase-like [Apis florea]|uniref:acyl-CoA desaturase-like n=1 Tax=Apis florea TaxID=7463 RepID=UPI0012FEEBD9|nr:acyl-CoA desaturase-like [Apis florea]
MKRSIDLRDIENDVYIYIQKIFYWPLFLIFGVILTLNAPLEYWDESIIDAILITGLLRFAITINISWLVNSAYLVWNIQEGERLIHIINIISSNVLYKRNESLFLKIRKSHDTFIDTDVIHFK